jgi:hypothetical protein
MMLSKIGTSGEALNDRDFRHVHPIHLTYEVP